MRLRDSRVSTPWKTLYYDNLRRVMTHNDSCQWHRFFLEGTRQTAENTIQTFHAIIALHMLFRIPIVDGQDFMTAFSIQLSTAIRLFHQGGALLPSGIHETRRNGFLVPSSLDD
jgi:hypothetical protein